MQQESTQELLGRQCHDLVARAALGAVVLPPTAHPALIHRNKSATRDGRTVRIARQVGQHRRGPANSRLA